MNIHTKEFLMDCLSLFGNLCVIVLLAYLIAYKDWSAWWSLSFFVFRFRFVPNEYLLNRKETEWK